MTIELNPTQAAALKATLQAICHNYTRYAGFRIGSSEVNNLYPEDIDDFSKIVEQIDGNLNGNY